MENYDKVPKMSQLNKVNKPCEPPVKKPNVPKRVNFPGVPDSYAKAPKDNSIYYKYITNLFKPPRLDALDIRIIEMEESLCAMIDDDPSELSPPFSA